jgi:hypothetical protein
MRLAGVLLWTVCVWNTGCAFGARALEGTHRPYNEAYRRVDSEELLLNIVRLRYGDAPAEVAVSSIAAQYELTAQAEAVPFFAGPSPSNTLAYRTFARVLPDAALGGAERPTISFTPIRSGDTIAHYLQPITPEGVVFLAGSHWPIGTVFRLWLEGINGVPNAPSGSGPTRSFPPRYTEFRRATELLQLLADRGELTFRTAEEEVLGDPITADRVSGKALDEARKAGFEYRQTPDRSAWQIVSRTRRIYLELSPRALESAEYQEVVRVLNLKSGLARYEVIQSTVGFIEEPPGAPPSDKLVLITRSLSQVLFYLSHGVGVPANHLMGGVAGQTLEPDGRAFDRQQVTGGLFVVKARRGNKPPPGAVVAVRYRDHWFYIDDADHDTKSTFVLLVPSRQLDVGAIHERK